MIDIQKILFPGTDVVDCMHFHGSDIFKTSHSYAIFF